MSKEQEKKELDDKIKELVKEIETATRLSYARINTIGRLLSEYAAKAFDLSLELDIEQ